MSNRRSRALPATFIVAGLLAGTPGEAVATPVPRDTIASQVRELARTQVKLARAKERRRELIRNAERLIEAYNGELVKVRRAEAEHAEVTADLLEAEQTVEQARNRAAALAADAYGVDLTRPMMALPGTPALLMRRAGLVAQLGDERAAVLDNLDDSREVLRILQNQAADMLDEAERAAEEAGHLKAAAEEAVKTQLAETRELRKEQREIEDRLNLGRFRIGSAAAPLWALTAEGPGGEATRWALTQLGKPYVWAADGPESFDCSGLTMRAWERVGVPLDHWTGTQWTAGPHVDNDDLRPGDLVFFGTPIHHVGLFIGRGLMVHAPQTGDVVRIASMWRPDYVGATRPG
ncbi:C40 family peptidase [Herbidospora sp. RD11066]